MKNVSIEIQLQRGDLSAITTYHAGVFQASAHRVLQKHCDAILQPYEITKMQWLIIGTVLDGGKQGIRLTDLATELSTTMSYITGEIKLLVSKGMLARTEHASDSRSKLISIDPNFLPQCKTIENVLRDGLRKSIYAGIDPAEFRIYMKVMYQLSKVPSE